jgi:antitoxin component HigA of HigAB toxin-antitoxin module
MNITSINTEEEYKSALKRLEFVFDAPKNSPESVEADNLVSLISEYEEKYYPIPKTKSNKKNLRNVLKKRNFNPPNEKISVDLKKELGDLRKDVEKLRGLFGIDKKDIKK